LFLIEIRREISQTQNIFVSYKNQENDPRNQLFIFLQNKNQRKTKGISQKRNNFYNKKYFKYNTIEYIQEILK